MGLLARATELLEREAREEWAEEQALRQTALEQAALLKGLNKKPHKLRKFVLGGMLGLGLAAATAPTTLKRPLLPSDLQLSKPQRQEQVVKHNFSEDELKHSLQAFQRDLGSRVSSMERDMMARMVYGEAGRGADPFEVIHTVLNRMSSPLFKGTAADIITQKNQYLGYKPTNPVTSDYRRMVDIAVDDWEANGCQIYKCGHFYFITDPNPKYRYKNNRFEKPQGANYQGQWIKTSEKQYEESQHYCHTALDQAARFFAERDGQTRGL